MLNLVLHEVFQINVLPKYYHLNILNLFDIYKHLDISAMREVFQQIMLERKLQDGVNINFDRDIYPKVKNIHNIDALKSAINDEISLLEHKAYPR
jgi:hypothetical protein